MEAAEQDKGGPMMVAFGAWIGHHGDRFVMHDWSDACVAELVTLLMSPFGSSMGIVIDVQRRVADREYARRWDSTSTHRKRDEAGAWAPGRPPIEQAGHLRPVNRLAGKVMGTQEGIR